MPKLKDIKQEILEQHRQLALNRRELNVRRWELRERLRAALRSRSMLLGAFAGGLLVGWLAWARPVRHAGSPLGKGMQTLGRWLAPVKGALWSGLIKTATNYTSDRISGELHEHRNQ